jgi:hypothetical protein
MEKRKSNLLYKIIYLQLQIFFCIISIGQTIPIQQLPVPIIGRGNGYFPIPEDTQPNFFTKLPDDSSNEIKVIDITALGVFKKFRVGSILFKDSSLMTKVLINMLKVTRRCDIFIKNEGVVNMSLIKRIVFEKDSSEKDYTIFQNGYRGKEDFAENLLYQVLSSGKIELLKKRIEILDSPFIMRSTIFLPYYRDLDALFTYTNKKLEKVKFTKSFFFEKFHEEKLDIMEEFVFLNKTNFRKVDDITNLIRFYNNLAD